tara:strand:+ start:32 stop:601 length:570 start_codon:yes stop_codon:yes gene_type:complete
MNKKVKISIQGNEFLLPSEAIQKCTYENDTYVSMRAKYVASIIKQYVKKNYPGIKVWSTSDVYSGGSSVRVEVSKLDGSQVDSSIFEDIARWKHILQGGSFDGMYDIYNYREDKPSTDNGTPMRYFPSYVFIENKPKWGSVEYFMNSLREFNETNSEWKDNIISQYGSWLRYNRQYMSDSVFNKVKELV